MSGFYTGSVFPDNLRTLLARRSRANSMGFDETRTFCLSEGIDEEYYRLSLAERNAGEKR